MNRNEAKAKYDALAADLARIEAQTSVYLADENVTRENVLEGGAQADDDSASYYAEMYRHAAAEAGARAEQADLDINALIGRVIY